MTARECVTAARAAGDAFQRAINVFVDEFRRADATGRDALVRDPIEQQGAMEGLVAGVVSQLCRETGMAAPAWCSVSVVRRRSSHFPRVRSSCVSG